MIVMYFIVDFNGKERAEGGVSSWLISKVKAGRRLLVHAT